MKKCDVVVRLTSFAIIFSSMITISSSISYADPIGDAFDALAQQYENFEFRDEGTIFKGPTFDMDGKISVQIGDRSFSAVAQDGRNTQQLIKSCDGYMNIGDGNSDNRCFASFQAQYKFPLEKYSGLVAEGSLYVELEIWDIEFKNQ